MIIRKYKRHDTVEVALLAMNTFKKYNGSDYFLKEGVTNTLNTFDPIKNTEQDLFEMFNRTTIFYVAEVDGKIVGMIRGLPNKISSLFVEGAEHQKGIGKKLIETFEKEAKKKMSKYIKVRSSLNAVSFYQKVGYRKTTGIRNFMGLKIYNMKRILN